MDPSIFSINNATILSSLLRLWYNFLGVVPGILAALIVLIVGYLISALVGHIIRFVLEKIGLNTLLQKAKLTKTIGHTDVPKITGIIIKWYVFIVFLQLSTELLNLGALSIALNKFVMWLPNLIASIIIVFVGLVIAHYIEIKMKEHSQLIGIEIIGKFLKGVVLFLAIVMALEQIGFEVSLLKNTFLIIVGGFALGFAIALGISLGFGLKKEGTSIVKEIKKRF